MNIQVGDKVTIELTVTDVITNHISKPGVQLRCARSENGPHAQPIVVSAASITSHTPKPWVPAVGDVVGIPERDCNNGHYRFKILFIDEDGDWFGVASYNMNFPNTKYKTTVVQKHQPGHKLCGPVD